MKILILTTLPRGEAALALKKAGEKRGHEMRILNPEELYVFISDLWKNDRLYHGETRIHKNQFDAVITRIGASRQGRVVINHIRQNMGKYCTQTVEGIANAADKLRTGQLLSHKGLKTPKTVFAAQTKNPELLIKLAGGLPVIAKTLTGSQGGGVMILESILSANSVLESFYNKNIPLLIQQYIEPDDTGAKDIRVIVIGGKVITAMQRIAPKGSFKANVSLGADAVPIELTEEQKQLAIDAANAVGLDTAGVDIMTSKDGTNYVIEVNSSHGWKIQKVVKDDIAAAYIQFVEENWKKPDTRDMVVSLRQMENNLYNALDLDEQDILDIAAEITDQSARMNEAKLTGEARSRTYARHIEELEKEYGKEKVTAAFKKLDQVKKWRS